jgi:putative oxidoreductase
VDTTLSLEFPPNSKFPRINSATKENCLLRRLFSTFAQGWPGVGLLLMRLVLGFALIWRAVGRLSSDPSTLVTVLSVLGIGAGVLLLMGLWTPVAATLVAAIELWKIYWKLGDPWIYLLLATIAAAIAMVGPGFWSVDARLYGWKRIEPPARKTLD